MRERAGLLSKTKHRCSSRDPKRRWLGIAEANSWMDRQFRPAINTSRLSSVSEADRTWKREMKQQKNPLKTIKLGTEAQNESTDHYYWNWLTTIFFSLVLPSSITLAIISAMFFSPRSIFQYKNTSGDILGTGSCINDYPVHIHWQKFSPSCLYMRGCARQ